MFRFVVMYLLLIILFVACVYAHPVQEDTIHKKYKIPTVADVKALEKEIWRATSSGDLGRAVKLESRLEADVVKATIGLLVKSKKDPVRTKRDLRKLGAVVRRDKRTAKFLSTILTTSAVAGINLLLGSNKNKVVVGKGKDKGEIGTLIRIPRQGKQYTFPIKPSNLKRRSDQTADTSLNEIIAPLTSPPPTINPFEVDIISTSTPVSITTLAPMTTTIVEASDDAMIADSKDSRKEETTPRAPAKQEEEDEDEGGGGIGGLITSFLGSLSTPEGGVDLDAVTGLLGGISTQNDDGTFDFTGLQDTVGSLFGNAEEGGSNVGQFLGGLVGATVRGSAGDEGAKGAGRLAGNFLDAVLPGLSAYPTPEDENAKPMEGLDSGDFIKGFLSVVLGTVGQLSSSSSSSSSGSGGGTYGQKPGSGAFLQAKFQLIKAAFSILSKILGASSSSLSSSKQTPQYGTPQYGTGTDTYYGPPPPPPQT